MAEELNKLEEIDRQIAAARRQKLALECKTDFLKFIKFTMPKPNDHNNIDKSIFQDAKHHRAIAKVLEEVARGKIRRLIVTLPPRHGKSEMISRRFIPWMMGKDSYKNVIFATYNEDFAQDFGADCRAIMSTTQFQQVFPDFAFRQGGASKSRVQTENGGMAVFVGRGGSITGRGGDVLVVDDNTNAQAAYDKIAKEMGLKAKDVKDIIQYAKKLKPSKRGELEITDLLNIYKNEKKLNFEHIGRGAIWSDAGKIDDMSNISTFVESVEKVEDIKIACLEEISLSKKWINKKTILKNIKFYGSCEYSNYLKKL